MGRQERMDEKTPIEDALRWSNRQRFNFLEQRIYWDGQLNRSDLVDRFAISIPQASADIARYTEYAPGNIIYDKSLKAYLPTDAFVPQFMQPDARKYLTQLLLMADQALAPEESWLGVVPQHDAIARVRRRLDATTLRPIVLAIHRRSALQVLYQSMSSPEPRLRWIAPHALAFDGARWHARSWCYNKSMFNDFVLARILSISGEKESGVDSSLDGGWHEHVTLQLGPNPRLSQAQRLAIERDYGMENGSISISMRLCLTYYFERQLDLDLPDDLLPPTRKQVVLLNRDEIESLRSER